MNEALVAIQDDKGLEPGQELRKCGTRIAAGRPVEGGEDGGGHLLFGGKGATVDKRGPVWQCGP
jgi:hypothetical protein